ncbi:hypothetical protein ACJ41O_004691 [Fusarium nematophilum]
MPPAEKKWDANAERDLCVAVIMGAQDGDRIRYNWPKVHGAMETLGYSFTKDAISQHFSKTIMRDFKARHGEFSSSSNSPAPSTKKASATRKRSTPGKGRTKKVKSSDDEDEDSGSESPLVKKVKRNKRDDDDDDVKVENDGDRKRERSATALDHEEGPQA